MWYLLVIFQLLECFSFIIVLGELLFVGIRNMLHFGKVMQPNLMNLQNYIVGWLRDHLWLNSSPLVSGYSLGINSLSVWAWIILFGHLAWATGLMF